MGNFSSFCFPQLSPNSLYYGFFMCARPVQAGLFRDIRPGPLACRIRVA
ncbi:MAG: hypothetical protein [Olavius algarvensis Gamma 1 endosymbiont]|nr:MAG: hypothetical protein [Olavius algarvensis Gamma 1 endosymbiont]